MFFRSLYLLSVLKLQIYTFYSDYISLFCSFYKKSTDHCSLCVGWTTTGVYVISQLGGVLYLEKERRV